MADETISSGSVEYIEAAVASRDDLSSATVSFAFLDAGSAGPPSTWTAGEWDPSGQTVIREVDGKYQSALLARILVGAGAVDLAVGIYDVWIRIELAPQDIQRSTGTLEVV